MAFPGFPHSGISYRWLFSEHDLEKIKVITFDLPGWIGESEGYRRSEVYSFDLEVDISKYILDYYRVNSYSLIGYSFGGAIALKAASEAPKKVNKIVLVSTVVNPLKTPNFYPIRNVNFITSWHLRFLLRRMVYRDFRKWKKGLIEDGLGPIFVEKYEELLRNADDRIMMESIYRLFHTDLSPYLDRLNGKKVMVINSQDEENIFKEQAEIIRRKLVGENSLVIRGTHVDFLLKPNHDVVDKIVDFLSAN